jgi:cytoskeletal protein RodZ
MKMAWAVLAIVGLLIAVGVSFAASRLASPNIGLSSEPITAGLKLAPAKTTAARPAKTKPKPKRKRKRPAKSAPTATTPQVVTPPAPAQAPAPAPVQPQPVAPSQPPATTPAAPRKGDDHGGRSPGSDDSSGGHGSDD